MARPSRFATPPEGIERPEEAFEVELGDRAPGWLKRSFGADKAFELLESESREDRLRGIEQLGAIGTREAVGRLAIVLDEGSDESEDAWLRLAAVRALAAHVGQEQALDALTTLVGMGGSNPSEPPPDALARESAALALALSGEERAITALVAAVIQGGEAAATATRALRTYPPESLGSVVGPRRQGPRPRGKGKIRPLPSPVARLLGELGDLRAVPLLRAQLRSKSVRAQLDAALALARLGDGSVEPLLQRWATASGPPSAPEGADANGDDRDGLGATEGAGPDDESQAVDGERGEAGAGAQTGPSARSQPRAAALANADRLAATHALLLLDTGGGDAALARLIAAPETRSRALSLAGRAPSPKLVGALEALLDQGGNTADAQRAVDVLARIGDDRASSVLLRMLARAELATSAAFGLAGSSSETARIGLQRALAGAAEGPARRLVLRAALVHRAKQGQTVPGLERALEQARQSQEPADRWIAAQGLALLGREPLARLLAAEDDEIALGAASVVGILGSQGLEACSARLAVEAQQNDRAGPRADWATGPPDEAATLGVVACGMALLEDNPAVSSSVLGRWAEAGGALAPLAARALAARDPTSERARLAALLAGTDPVVRAHVALGLGLSGRPDATTRLARAYRSEATPSVRRAIVRALSRRADPLRRAPLELAARLDPDDEARGLARSALRGSRHCLGRPAPGAEVLWVSLVGPSGGAKRAPRAHRALRVARADGLVVPAVSAPDGNVLVWGLPRVGGASVQLAPDRTLRDALP